MKYFCPRPRHCMFTKWSDTFVAVYELVPVDHGLLESEVSPPPPLPPPGESYCGKLR